MEIEKISLAKVFRVALEEKKYVKKYVEYSFGNGGMSFCLELESGMKINLRVYDYKSAIWFMGFSQNFDTNIGVELIKLFDGTSSDEQQKNKDTLGEFLLNKFGEVILN